VVESVENALFAYGCLIKIRSSADDADMEVNSTRGFWEREDKSSASAIARRNG
jgi:hypothetical protein